MGESDAGYMATLTDRELNDYRETLEWTLAQAQLPKLSLPREELQAQLAPVLAELARRTGSGDAQP
ncbi:MAG: hypothetical protein M3Z75_32425 [Actinomycetota bacterium]|nr:hypothetical protein [Actinomycetota bacterium]